MALIWRCAGRRARSLLPTTRTRELRGCSALVFLLEFCCAQPPSSCMVTLCALACLHGYMRPRVLFLSVVSVLGGRVRVRVCSEQWANGSEALRASAMPHESARPWRWRATAARSAN